MFEQKDQDNANQPVMLSVGLLYLAVSLMSVYTGSYYYTSEYR